MSIFLKDATYIDWESLEFRKSNLKVSHGVNGKVEFVGTIPPKTRADQILNCQGKFVTKSFGNAHHHIYSVLSRGMPAPKTTPENFYEILKYVWWNLDKKLDIAMIEASALFAAMESLKSGVTFVIDHHSSPFAIEGSLETIAGAFEFLGVSHLLCYEISDRDGMQTGVEGFTNTEHYLKTSQGLVGLHASFTLSDHSLRRAALLVEKFKSGVHIHVAEDQYDQDHCKINYKKTVVERLNEFGFLQSPKTILAHCLHLSKNEKKLISDSPAWVVENIESNLNNKVGVFNAKGLGDLIMLGTDGMHSDMLRSAQYAYFAGQITNHHSPGDIYKRFRNVHHYLQNNGFTGDGENNLVVLDYDSPTEMNSENFLGHFIYGLNSKNVEHVISKGEIVVKDRRLVNMNEEDILGFAREMGSKLWKKLKE
jgi:cytosine/adenosine deaminase-related metal-dependent hydrolase